MMKILSPAGGIVRPTITRDRARREKRGRRRRRRLRSAAAVAAASDGPNRSSFFRLIATLRFKRSRRRYSSWVGGGDGDGDGDGGGDGGSGGGGGGGGNDYGEKKPAYIAIMRACWCVVGRDMRSRASIHLNPRD